MKKVLLLSDLHQKRFLLSMIEGYVLKHNIDAVFVLGDLTDRNDNSLSYAKDFYSMLTKIKKSFFYIHGNNESQEVIDFFSSKRCFVHNKSFVFGGVRFLGLGGWGDEFNINMGKFIKGSFFLTHIPPRIKDSRKMHNAPIVHAFGHSHRNEYKKKLGGTTLLSLKASSIYRRGAVVELPTLSVKFISLDR